VYVCIHIIPRYF